MRLIGHEICTCSTHADDGVFYANFYSMSLMFEEYLIYLQITLLVTAVSLLCLPMFSDI